MALIRPQYTFTRFDPPEYPNEITLPAGQFLQFVFANRTASPTFAELLRFGTNWNAQGTGAMRAYLAVSLGSDDNGMYEIVNPTQMHVLGYDGPNIDAEERGWVLVGEATEPVLTQQTPINVASYFGGIVPERWSLFIENATNQDEIVQKFAWWATVMSVRAESV